MTPPSFGLLNTTILALYLTGMLLIGWLFSRRKQNADQFFLGGRNLPWLAVAMSMYASLTSAVTYIGLPATAYQENIALIAVSFASLAVAPIILKLFYPFYHRHRVTTSYQFIQQRFGLPAQRSVATLFVLSRLGWLGTVVYAPALALAAATRKRHPAARQPRACCWRRRRSVGSGYRHDGRGRRRHLDHHTTGLRVRPAIAIGCCRRAANRATPGNAVNAPGGVRNVDNKSVGGLKKGQLRLDRPVGFDHNAERLLAVDLDTADAQAGDRTVGGPDKAGSHKAGGQDRRGKNRKGQQACGQRACELAEPFRRHSFSNPRWRDPGTEYPVAADGTI